MARVKKKERQQLLLQQVKEKPFLTDEELAQKLNVSVQTIRLDRLELGIPELRGRIRKMAESAQNKVKSIESGDVVGDEGVDDPADRAPVHALEARAPLRRKAHRSPPR